MFFRSVRSQNGAYRIALSVVRFMTCPKALRCEGDRYADWASETTRKRERRSYRNVHLRSRRGWTDDDMRSLATAFHPYLHPPQSNRVPHPSVANAIRRIYFFLWDTPRIQQNVSSRWLKWIVMCSVHWYANVILQPSNMNHAFDIPSESGRQHSHRLAMSICLNVNGYVNLFALLWCFAGAALSQLTDGPDYDYGYRLFALLYPFVTYQARRKSLIVLAW